MLHSCNIQEHTAMRFSQLLVKYRTQNGMTIVELAEATGLDRNRISAWEHGKGIPRDRGRLMELAEALQLSSEEERDFAAAAGEFRQQGITKQNQKSSTASQVLREHERVIYNMRLETQPFSDWLLVSEGEQYAEKIRFFQRAEDNLWSIEIRSLGNEVVGVNKSIGTVLGKVEFDYKVQASQNGMNAAVYIIPLREIWTGRSEFVEAGLESGIPEYLRRSYREYLKIPLEVVQDNQWHQAVLPFDFRDLPRVVYTVFAPRINEGCKDKGIGHLIVSDVRVTI
jgi:transcriptional regulator with XRE-family HTH domain